MSLELAEISSFWRNLFSQVSFAKVNTNHRVEMDFWILSLEGLVLTYLLELGKTGFSASPRKFLSVERY